MENNLIIFICKSYGVKTIESKGDLFGIDRVYNTLTQQWEDERIKLTGISKPDLFTYLGCF